jgi:hypothetical protein
VGAERGDLQIPKVRPPPGWQGGRQAPACASRSRSARRRRAAPPTPHAPPAPLPLSSTHPQQEVIEKLRYSVFGFDTLWVTSVDNYQVRGVWAGVWAWWAGEAACG